MKRDQNVDENANIMSKQKKAKTDIAAKNKVEKVIIFETGEQSGICDIHITTAEHWNTLGVDFREVYTFTIKIH